MRILTSGKECKFIAPNKLPEKENNDRQYSRLKFLTQISTQHHGKNPFPNHNKYFQTCGTNLKTKPTKEVEHPNLI